MAKASISCDVSKIVNRLENMSKTLFIKHQSFLRRLSAIGVDTANIAFSDVTYDGSKGTLPASSYARADVKWVSSNKLKIVAKGEGVVFIEFGSGMKGAGHPTAVSFGFGPGTYSDSVGKGQWMREDGWIYKYDLPRSKGNEPAMAMYLAGKNMREMIEQIALEVYG